MIFKIKLGIWTAKHHGVSTTKGCHKFENYISTIFKINIFGQKCRHVLQEPDKFYIRVTKLTGGLIISIISQLSLFLSHVLSTQCALSKEDCHLKKKKPVLFDVCCSKKIITILFLFQNAVTTVWFTRPEVGSLPVTGVTSVSVPLWGSPNVPSINVTPVCYILTISFFLMIHAGYEGGDCITPRQRVMYIYVHFQR